MLTDAWRRAARNRREPRWPQRQVAIESVQRGITVVRPQGALDMHSVPAFHQTLAAAVQRAACGLIVALADVTYVDSAGLAALIEGLRWSRGQALPYLLTPLTPAVQRVLELARLEQVFPIAASVEDAVAQITQMPAQCERSCYQRQWSSMELYTNKG